jgi:hypothetical protein
LDSVYNSLSGPIDTSDAAGGVGTLRTGS